VHGGGEADGLRLCQQEQRVPQFHEQRLRICLPVQRSTATTATHTCQMGARGLEHMLDLVSSIESPF
jgi:hypothetical protein